MLYEPEMLTVEHSTCKLQKERCTETYFAHKIGSQNISRRLLESWSSLQVQFNCNYAFPMK